MAGKIAIITGAASGIGAALARSCVKQGYCVGLCDIDSTGLKAIADELSKSVIISSVIDVADIDSVTTFAGHVFEITSNIDLLFNNAGIMIPGKVWEQPIQEWHNQININLMGTVNFVHAFLPKMIQSEHKGRVINTASIAGFLATPSFGAYSATKHAIVALSQSLLHDLRSVQANISVSVIAPGAVATELMKNTLTRNENLPNDVARLVSAMDTKVSDSGMSTEQLASFVLEEIADEKFWILPHHEGFPRILNNVENMISGVGPESFK